MGRMNYPELIYVYTRMCRCLFNGYIEWPMALNVDMENYYASGINYVSAH
jgi:hypothetical protein